MDFSNNTSVPEFKRSYFLACYRKYPTEEDFLNIEREFNLLIGTSQVIKEIIEGKTEQELNDSRTPELSRYKEIR